jgi:hypothetical protein
MGKITARSSRAKKFSACRRIALNNKNLHAGSRCENRSENPRRTGACYANIGFHIAGNTR